MKRQHKVQLVKYTVWILSVLLYLTSLPLSAQAQDNNTSLYLPFVSGQNIEETEELSVNNGVFNDAAVSPMKTIAREQVTPFSLREQVSSAAVSSQADIVLPPVNLEQLREEDRAAASSQSGRRIGIVRDLSVIAAALRSQKVGGQWQETSDGGHYQIITIESPDAYAIRVHVENLEIPTDGHVMIYDTNEVSEVYGPYRARDLFGTTELWTESVFGSTVTLEYYAPPSTNVEDIKQFEIGKIAHIYMDPIAEVQASALSCQNDISCSANWATEESSVAGLGTIGTANVLWCSGALINDFDDDTNEQYFLTANHCLSGNSSDLGTQVEANTIEFYWRYQTTTCNGTIPALNTITRTGGGADLISRQTRNSGNDHALLRIRNDLPGGLTLAGWDTRTPNNDENLTGIHHPDGEHKRISFGDYDGSDSNYWFVDWRDGTTEGGSSGSPLFDVNRRLIGQLWGGNGICTTSEITGESEYGRFNKTFSAIERWMRIGGTLNVNSRYRGNQLGTPDNPFITTSAAHNFAWDGSRIRFKTGAYPGAITLRKEVTLIAEGGIATLGQ